MAEYKLHNRAQRQQEFKDSKAYKAAYYQGRERSVVTNPQLKGPSADRIRNEIQRIEGLEIEIQRTQGRIEQAEADIAKIENDFDKLQQASMNNALDIPEVMPQKMKEAYHKALARLDVCKDELSRLEVWLSEKQKKQQSERLQNLFRRGPRGVSQGEPCAYIDNQFVAIAGDNETLFIQDELSPYNGMSLQDYKQKLVAEFLKTKPKPNKNIKELPPWPSDVEPVKQSGRLVKDIYGLPNVVHNAVQVFG